MKFKLAVLSAIMTLSVGCSKPVEEVVIPKVKDVRTPTLIEVIDGDSLLLEYDDKIREVTLNGIDAPELMSPKYEEQPFSNESKDYLESLIEDEQLILELKENGEIPKIELRFGEHQISVNAVMVRTGFARTLGHVYSSEVETAKKNKENIWSIEGYVDDKGYVMGLEASK